MEKKAGTVTDVKPSASMSSRVWKKDVPMPTSSAKDTCKPMCP